MSKYQYDVIWYLLLTMFAGVTVASDVIKEIASIETPPFEEFSKHVTQIILEYVESHTGFEYILQNKKCYHDHRSTLKQIAFQQYCSILTSHPSPDKSNDEYWHQIRRYAKFLQSPLDPTVSLPEPILLFFHWLRPRTPILCSTLVTAPEATEAELLAFFQQFDMYAYNHHEEGMWTKYQLRRGPMTGSFYSLPLVYDPAQTLLHLWPLSDTQQGRLSSLVRFPAMLVFVRRSDAKTPHIERVSAWSAVQWIHNTNGQSGLTLKSIITWFSSASGWILKTFVLEDGLIKTIEIYYKEQTFKFTTVDNGRWYVRLLREEEQASSDFTYTMIQPFYYPITSQPNEYVGTDQPNKNVGTDQPNDHGDTKQLILPLVQRVCSRICIFS